MSTKQTIIIKKSDDDHHDDHHGGGWKVAYADFMTAMMAFFLLLWIIAATDEQKLHGLAEYFTPSLIELKGGSEGLLDGQVVELGGEVRSADGLPDAPPLPRFGEESPMSVFDSRARDVEPEVVIEYAETPAPTEPTERELAEAAEAEQQAAREAELDDFAEEIEDAIAGTPGLAEVAGNLRFDRTPEGLLLQIVDEENRPMFDSGSAAIAPKMHQLLDIVGKAIVDMPHQLVISGHTDSRPFAGSTSYTNWELSSDRANATRRALLDAGLPRDRIAQVSGLADTKPLVSDRPDAPENRRISVLLAYPDQVSQPVGLDSSSGR